jgi:hypothetical protein
MNTLARILAFILLFSAFSCPKKGGKILLSEIEINGVLDKIRRMPDFVALGTYETRFFTSVKRGNFKIYKTGDSMWVRLNDGATFLISLNMLKHENFRNSSVRLAGDTFEILGKSGYYLRMVGDRIEEFRGEGISARLSNYSTEPVRFPKKWIVRYMGAIIILNVEEITLLY